LYLFFICNNIFYLQHYCSFFFAITMFTKVVFILTTMLLIFVAIAFLLFYYKNIHMSWIFIQKPKVFLCNNIIENFKNKISLLSIFHCEQS
jgi:hypothetical protein